MHLILAIICSCIWLGKEICAIAPLQSIHYFLCITWSISWLLIIWWRNWPGPQFNIKLPFYQYRKSHCGDKTVEMSFYLHSESSCTGKMTSWYWIRAQYICSRQIERHWWRLGYLELNTRWTNHLHGSSRVRIYIVCKRYFRAIYVRSFADSSHWSSYIGLQYPVNLGTQYVEK